MSHSKVRNKVIFSSKLNSTPSIYIYENKTILLSSRETAESSSVDTSEQPADSAPSFSTSSPALPATTAYKSKQPPLSNKSWSVLATVVGVVLFSRYLLIVLVFWSVVGYMCIYIGTVGTPTSVADIRVSVNHSCLLRDVPQLWDVECRTWTVIVGNLRYPSGFYRLLYHVQKMARHVGKKIRGCDSHWDSLVI